MLVHVGERTPFLSYWLLGNPVVEAKKSRSVVGSLAKKSRSAVGKTRSQRRPYESHRETF